MKSVGTAPVFQVYIFPHERIEIFGPSEEMLIGSIVMEESGKTTFHAADGTAAE